MRQEFGRSLDELANIVAFTGRFFESGAADRSLKNVVDLCVEELFVNMLRYNRESVADILIEIGPQDSGVRVSLTDFDVERFDPHDAPPVDVDAPLAEREPGGLGLYLVMKMANAVHYEYRDRVSKITFIADRKDKNAGH